MYLIYITSEIIPSNCLTIIYCVKGKHGTLAAKQRMAKLYRKNTDLVVAPVPSASPGSGLPSQAESITHSRNEYLKLFIIKKLKAFIVIINNIFYFSSTEFTWVDAEAKSDTLNELVTCIAANEHV